mgnify:FL=1
MADVLGMLRQAVGTAWDINKTATIAGGVGASVTATGLVGGLAAFNYGARASGWRDYRTPGWLGSFGFMPTGVNAAGQGQFRGWGFQGTIDNKALLGATFEPTAAGLATRGQPFSKAFAKSHMPGNVLGLAANSYMMYQGYQENGVSGAYDSLALSVAAEASVYKWATGIGLARVSGGGWLSGASKLAGHPLSM